MDGAALPYTIDWKNPDYSAVIEHRKLWLTYLREDPARWVALKEHYKTHPADFVEHWGWTVDPRNAEIDRATVMPFVLFPRQRAFLEWLYEGWRERSDGTVEKSRDMGATWLCVAFAVWMWAFFPGSIVGFGSRKEEYVDKSGDPKSIFWKVRQFIAMLPWELRGEYYSENRDANYMRVLNPGNAAVIIGEAGDNIGRGNRTSIYFVDEAAFLEHADAVDSALSMTTNVAVHVSTPNGVGNAFYRRVKGRKVPLFIFDWRDDPRKDQAWYDKFVGDKGPVVAAQEVDRNYEGSVTDAYFDGPLVQAAARRGPVEVQPRGGLRVGIDVARFGDDTTVLTFRRGRVLLRQIPSPKLDVMQTASWAKHQIDTYVKDAKVPLEQIAVDVIGIGAGVADILRSAGWYPDKPLRDGKVFKIVVDVNSSIVMNNGRDYNLKAFMASEVKDWLKNASIPNEQNLTSDLTAIRYGFRQGLYLLESKEQAKARGVKSPDYYDSLATTFAVPTIVRPRLPRASESEMYVDGVM